MTPKAKGAATKLLVSRQFTAFGKPVAYLPDTDEEVAINNFVTEPARVMVEMGMSVNLGNYENARISVSLTVPCYFEEHEAAYEYAKKWVSDRVLEEVREARSFAQGRQPSKEGF